MRRFLDAGALLPSLALGATLVGCGAGWRTVPPTPETTIPSRKQVLVYHGGAVERWHAVRITGDSVTGIPWLRPIEGDTGRIALPRATVDSLSAGDPATGFVKSYLLSVYVIAPVTLILLCGLSHGCPSGD